MSQVNYYPLEGLTHLLRHLEDVLIPVWRGDDITPAHRKMARGLWERVVDTNDKLRASSPSGAPK